MTALNAHPIFRMLMDKEVDVYPVQLDDRTLEQIMIQEENQFTGTLSQVRVVERNDVGISQYKPAEGNLTSRIFSLLEATRGCILQSEFNDQVIEHPAFALVRDELRAAYDDGSLNQKFDIIEATGAVVTFEKARGLVSIGLNEAKMRGSIQEYTKMVDLNNKTLINRANGVTSYDIFKEPRDTPQAIAEMTTSFFVSFAV